MTSTTIRKKPATAAGTPARTAVKTAARPPARLAQPAPLRAARAATPAANGTSRWGYEVQNKEEQSALKRLAILRTAAQLFNERGFYATSLNDLAGLLNVTKPSLYYYVKSKDDILLQILHHAMEQIDPAITLANETGTSGLDKLRIFVRKYIDVLTGDFGKCLVLSGSTPLEPVSRAQIAPSFRYIDQSVRKMVAEGVADGSIAPCDPKIAAFSLFGALHWMTSWYRADGELGPDELATQIFTIFSAGLQAQAKSPKKK
ncbi:MAG: TetR/AcrR family transcriptional regulator [Comamonadaceae bacterium]|nr:MAG: TetR/AcrR family transcriptional regulator [Comamonadaceae bacterium]